MGVVVVDHGSRRAASNEQLERFAELYAATTGRAVVEAAHMELAPPTIAEAFGRCVERGATLVVVAPFFLSPGRHWQEDIPALVDEAESALQAEGGRVLLRYSGTEPKIRLLLEGKDAATLDAWSEKIMSAIQAQIGEA